MTQYVEQQRNHLQGRLEAEAAAVEHRYESRLAQVALAARGAMQRWGAQERDQAQAILYEECSVLEARDRERSDVLAELHWAAWQRQEADSHERHRMAEEVSTSFVRMIRAETESEAAFRRLELVANTALEAKERNWASVNAAETASLRSQLRDFELRAQQEFHGVTQQLDAARAAAHNERYWLARDA